MEPAQLSCVEREDLLVLAPFLWQFYEQFYKFFLSTFKVDPTVRNRAGSIFYSYILQEYLEKGETYFMLS